MWWMVLPVKRLPAAKTRLRGAVDGVPHDRLVRAVVTDTLGAVVACRRVHRTILVTADPAVTAAARVLGVQVVPDRPDRGLNAALEHGARVAVEHGAERVAALTADLPALRPAELAAALDAAEAADRPRTFVADAEGTGTTLLTATRTDLAPRFGPGSAAAHAASGAVALTGGWPSLRRDVDTAADLAAATTLGLGTHTADLRTAADRTA